MDRIQVLLEGGPADLGEDERRHEVPALTEQIKLARGAGYEHFQYSGRSRETVPVFQWCSRTMIAE